MSGPERPAPGRLWLAVPLLLAACVVFHPVLQGRVLGGHVSRQEPHLRFRPEGSDPRFTDIEVQMLPFLALSGEELSRGRIPLWNPYAGCGAPLLANQQCAALHPFTHLGLLFGWRQALTVIGMCRFLMAFGGTFLLCRTLALSRPASATGAAGYALSGVFLEWLGYPHGSVFGQMPLALALARLAARRGGTALPLALGATLWSTIVAGHLEYLPLIWGAAGLAYVHAAAGPMWRRVAAIGLLMALAAAGSGAMIVPSVEYLAQKRDIEVRPKRIAAAPTSGESAQELDDAVRQRRPNRLARVRTFYGLPVLVLAAAALGRRRAWPVAAVSALTLLLLQPMAPVRALWALPVMNLIVPDRLIVPLGLGLGVLAAYAVEAMREAKGAGLLAAAGLGLPLYLHLTDPPYQPPFLQPLPRATAVSFALAGALVLLAFLCRRGAAARLAPALVLAILLVERTWIVARFNAWSRPAALFPRLELLDRAAVLAGSDRFVAPGRLVHPNVATAYRLRDARIYDVIGVGPYQAAVGSLRRGGGTLGAAAIAPAGPDPFVRQAAIRVLVLPAELKAPWTEEDACWEGMCLAVDPAALPRARLAGAATDRGAVRFLDDSPTRVTLEVRAPAADRLVLADARYPGWVARRDGLRIPIDAEGPFRSVAVPAGRSTVTMRYEPASFRLGLFVSGLVLMAAAAFTVRPAREPARRP